FEKKKVCGEVQYSIAGYVTVYHYYAYPDQIRPRSNACPSSISKQGHGAELLRMVEEHYIQDPKVLDITVEEPSEQFLRLRDYVDALGLQCRRVYEILRLKATDRSDPKEYKEYRLDVKRRLNTSYQKEKSDFEKLKKVLSPEELSATMCLESTG
ncbi:hypothetical protein QZH41_012019, partial [Actinostola sp. cb2023]